MKSFFFKRLPVLLFGLLTGCIVFGQLAKTTADTIKLQQLLNQGQADYRNAKYEPAIKSCHEVLDKARKSGLKKYEAGAYNLLADIMLANGKMADVKKYDSLLMPMALQIKDTSLIIDVKNRDGVYLLEQGKTSEAADNFLSVLQMRLEKEQSAKTAEVYSNLASVYMSLSKKEQAMEWFFKALRVYEKLGDERGQGETYSNVSSLYYLMGSIDEAIRFQNLSIFYREKQKDLQGLVIPHLNIGQLYILRDSFALALKHLGTAVDYAEQIHNVKLMGSAYSGMSAYYIRMKKFDKALTWQDKSIALFEQNDNKPLLSRMYISAGNLANNTGDSLAAVTYYNKGLNLSIQLGNKENIANAYEKISTFYTSHNDYPNAYRNYKEYVLYKDTISMTSALASIEKVKIQYETEKKDNEIVKLNADQRIKQLQIEKQNALLAGNELEAQRKEKEIELLSQAKELQELKISQQDEQLEKQKLLAKNNDQQLQLAEKEKQLQQRQLKNSRNIRNFILAGVALLALLGYFLFNRYQLQRKIQEQESLLAVRNNIAKDLHDEIGSTLTSIRILSEVSGKNLSKDQVRTSAFLQKITEQSAAVQQGISDIVWAVKPENDKLENMVVRMREYVSQTLESKNIHTTINIDEQLLSKTLDMNQRRDFLLVFKEAVNNVAKYAEASEVMVNLKKNNGSLWLEVVDNGKGFDVNKKTSSSGLKNMKERASSLGGTLTIDSSDRGSTVSLVIPAT